MQSQPLKLITEALKSALIHRIFKCTRGRVFVERNNDILYIIQLYISRRNTNIHSVVTVELGIISLPLAKKQMEAPTEYYPYEVEKKPSMSASHWNWRIGHILPERKDIWWDISTVEQAEIAATEISLAVTKYALPVMSQIQSTADLVALWETGGSPG